jgi:hypothetical protein
MGLWDSVKRFGSGVRAGISGGWLAYDAPPEECHGGYVLDPSGVEFCADDLVIDRETGELVTPAEAARRQRERALAERRERGIGAAQRRQEERERAAAAERQRQAQAAALREYGAQRAGLLPFKPSAQRLRSPALSLPRPPGRGRESAPTGRPPASAVLPPVGRGRAIDLPAADVLATPRRPDEPGPGWVDSLRGRPRHGRTTRLVLIAALVVLAVAVFTRGRG